MPERRPPPPPPEDDALDELPPLDDGDEAGDEAEEEQGLVGDEPDPTGDPFDDATGEGDPVDPSELADAGGDESGWAEGDGDAETLDLGDDGTEALLSGDEHDALADVDEPGASAEEPGGRGLDVDAGDEWASDLDGGEEGPAAEDEEMSEADLPPLDADEAGEVDDADLLDPELGASLVRLDEPPEGAALPPWSARPWLTAGAPVRVAPARAVACAARGVVAGGRGVVSADLEGACESAVGFGERPVVSVAAEGTTLAVLTPSGELLLSSDGGTTFSLRAAWRAHAPRQELVEVAFADGRLWALSSEGALVSSGDRGESWDLSRWRALALDPDPEGGLAILAADAAGEPVAVVLGVSRSDTPRERPIPRALAGLPDSRSGRALLAVRGDGQCAFAWVGGPVILWGAAGFARVSGLDEVTAMAFVGERGGVLASAVHDQGTAWVVATDAEGVSAIVAEVAGERRVSRGRRGRSLLSDDEGEGIIRALRWDPAHGVLWVAGDFGLVALEPRD